MSSMRDDTATMIADNPSTVTISRKTRVKSNGKLTAATSTIAAQTVRLYSKNVSVDRMAEEGRFVRRREVRMLCLYNANVLPHSNLNEDTFTLSSKTYRIKDVRDVTWEGSVISKQCVLEEIGHGSGT